MFQSCVSSDSDLDRHKRISSRSLGNIGARAVVLKINIKMRETASKEEALRLCAIKMNFESSWHADSEGLIYLL